MFKKFVVATALLNFLFAPMVIAQAVQNPAPASFVFSFTIAGFFMMAASLLIWASRDLPARAPVLFWSAVSRLVAITTVTYAVPNGLADPSQYAFVVFDGVTAIIYILGALRVTGRSFLDFLLWRIA
ncbi:hypothetical protein SAMN06273572_11012 [Monaibacterium marinum]|uniref:Uncharacterized protein n=1 Tax=Pontivivens marinum TaxID=1690039 RepID=A0A2C9CVV2_9RHOB|nr:hypothetical protein [Monaibacterium marinum]SOH95343.1 hypothetical protein SAMN06273572_11012 [Monaibacterium marinum]